MMAQQEHQHTYNDTINESITKEKNDVHLQVGETTSRERERSPTPIVGKRHREEEEPESYKKSKIDNG